MKKNPVLMVILGGMMLLSLCSCGETADVSADESTESSSAFEAYCQTVSDDEIVFESETYYVDSQILLTAADGVPKSQIEELIESQGGSIVGYLSISNDYQIEFADGKTYEELDAIIADWENDDNVEAVSLNYVSQLETDSIDYTSDPWIDADNASDTSGSEWSEISPEGNNWWAEAIMMPSVWDMDVEFQTVKVGIYDTMFDTDNEDLQDAFVKIWNNPEDEDGNCTVKTLYSSAEQATGMYTHGTHVAGLIAAEAENGVGIAGVSQNALLYGFSYMTDPVETEDVSCWGSLFENKYSIALMLNEGVKVINLSISKEELLVAAQNGVEKALTTLEEWSSSYERFLKKCLEAGYDFLIVKSSGNENEYNWTSCEVSKEHPYGYMQDDTAEDAMVYDAQYDFLGAIEDETVKSHILIVGAAENHTDYYTIASFSTVGKRVDVYAPGVNILSDLPINDSGVITGMDSGTSMSTAIVSGVAALVWGANPDLSAVQVANIIRASATRGLNSEDVSDTEESTPIVNAYFAVQLALATTGEGNEAECSVGILTGMTYITEEDDSVSALSDVTVTVADADGNTVETVDTSKRSGYTFILPAGTYTITAEADGYDAVSKDITLAESEVLNLNFEMVESATEFTGYAEILNLFYSNITSGWEDYEESYSYGSIGDVSYMFPWYYAEESYIDSIGYTLMDLDGNGVPELIIGIDGDGENRYTDSSMIYDLYTYVQGEIVHLATSGERYWYELCEDNTIYYCGSAGAASARYGHYSLNEGEDALSVLECVWSDPDDNWENTYWYYSTLDFLDDDAVQISEDDASAITDSWPQTVELTLTPFSSYTP